MRSIDTDAQFVYNENGLRVKKTVNGVVTDYTLHGKNVVHMTKGNDELHFFYDAQNRPAIVVYNGVAYAYQYNLQGDIVALLNGAGNVVVSYAYDAWGAPLWCTGELAETLGKVQPFRYRGYVFDEETGLYYLRSRYYNATLSRFINADVLCGNNQYTYCKNSSIALIDNSGYGPTMCFDENGCEASLLTQFGMGGGSGGSSAGLLLTRTSQKRKETSLDESGEYALYDNQRFHKDSVFHEQIAAITVDTPSVDVASLTASAGVEFDLMTGGWEWGDDAFAADLSLLDVGHAELGASIGISGVEIAAMASMWSPSASVTLFGIEISIGAEIGAVGLGVDADFSLDGGISLKGAFWLGLGIGIDW